MEQRTDEWFNVRLGKVTASRISDLMAKTKTGASASRENYKTQLVLERVTGLKESTYINDAMQWGIDKEEEARQAYEFITNNKVDLIGFVNHPSINMAGASPDGRVNNDGLIEIKCPNSTTHLNSLITETIADKYIKQMQWQMACENRQWCDYVSYDPRFPLKNQLFIKRVERDNDLIAEMETAVIEFLKEVDEMVAKLA